jgi:N4-gp56 family major capsid protein
MADVFTGATSAAGSGQLTNQVLTAYQRSALFALRDELIFDQFSRYRPGNLTNPGTPISFLFWSDLATATTPLSEVVDVDAVGLSDSTKTLTPAEYGNAVLMTLRIRLDNYLIGWDADVSDIVNRNMVETIDELARTELDNATNADTADGGAVGALTATALIRTKHAELRADNVRPMDGTLYTCLIHPETAYDLKTETGDQSWLVPAAYVDTARIYNNEIGTFAGFKFVESNRGELLVDGGASTADVYRTYFLGQDALAKGESVPPHIVMGPVTDKLMRFQPLGWHTYVGWKILREEGIRTLQTVSTIGANT